MNGKPATQFAFASNGKPIAFAANQTYWLALEAVARGHAPPRRRCLRRCPATRPTRASPPRSSPSPAVVAFASVSSAPVAVTFAEQGFSGAFTLHGDCTGIVNTSGSEPDLHPDPGRTGPLRA